MLQLLPAMEAGGAERSTLEVAQALVAAGHRSIVVSAGGRLVAQLQSAGAEHHSLPIAGKSLRTLLQLRRLRGLLAELRPDLIHVRSRLPAWLCWWALGGQARPHRPALVSTVHGLNSVNAYSAIMTRADRVICVSRTTAEHVARHYPQLPAARTRVIQRGVDLARLGAERALDPAWRKRLAEQHPALAAARLLLLPGRGSRLKGHESALRLLAALRGQGLDVCLAMPGARQPGREAYLAEMVRLSRELGVEGHWQALPSVDDIGDWYRHADLVLQLSQRPESFGRTVSEALAMGRPVLGWDLGGVGEQLREVYPAGLVELANETALAQRAAGLLADPKLQTIDRGRITTVDQMQRATLAVYAELLS